MGDCSIVKVKPFNHQIKGMELAINRFNNSTLYSKGFALLMEMGTGKTLTSILIAGKLYQEDKINKVLIVAPLSILGVWEQEFIKFANFEYDLKVLAGSLANKRKQLMSFKDDEKLKIAIVNYESAWRMKDELLKFNADLIIADEGHKLKDNRSSQSKGMQELGDKARYKLLLTGTVITNKEIDIFSQYRFLDKSIFGDSFYKWRNYYFTMGGYGLHTPIFKKTLTDEFQNKFMSIAYRVRKDECLDLPQITEEVRALDLEPEAMKVYKQLEDEMFARFKDDKELTVTNVLTKILRLSQVTGGYLPNDNDSQSINISTVKMEALIDIIDSARQEDKKVVVIARFNEELNAIENMLKLKKINYSVVRGSIKNRDEQISDFQNNPEFKVFVGQIATCGLGITLTAASIMVFYSMDYSMSNFEQCKARIHRAGQKENCHYIYLVCKNTIDRKVLRALRNKIDLAKSLVYDFRTGKKISEE